MGSQVLFLVGTIVISSLSYGADYEQRTARLTRFGNFLEETKDLHYRAGALRQNTSGPSGQYQDAILLDPNYAVTESQFVINRYESYINRLNVQRSAEGLSQVNSSGGVPPGFSTPEMFQDSAGDPNVDATAAVNAALSIGKLWLTHGKTYLISSPLQIVEKNNVEIRSDGYGVLKVAVGSGGFYVHHYDANHPYDPSQDHGYNPVIFAYKTNGLVISDIRLHTPVADPAAPQPLLYGIRTLGAHQVQISGVEARGFARTNGVFKIDSSSSVRIYDNLIHGSFTRVRTRQTTGILIDHARMVPDGVYVPTRDLEIRGNFIFGMLFSRDVYFDTFFREEGRGLGYETDAINYAAMESCSSSIITNNSLMDVGEGIDTFCSGGTYTNNHIERANHYGIKVVHSASSGNFSGNTVVASGFASIVVSGSAGRSVVNNRFVNNTLRYPGAFILQNRGNAPLMAAAAILVQGNQPSDVSNNLFQSNRVESPMYTNESLWQAAAVCKWESSGGGQRNNFDGNQLAGGRLISANGCGEESASVPPPTPTPAPAPAPNLSCNFRGRLIPHGGSVTAYQQGSLPPGYSCAKFSEQRVCNNGLLSGSYQNESCFIEGAPPTPAPAPAPVPTPMPTPSLGCSLRGQPIPHGGSIRAYQQGSLPAGYSCEKFSELRTCTNGQLSGSYQNLSCAIEGTPTPAPAPAPVPTPAPTPNLSCNFNGQTLAHGASVTAYQQGSLPPGYSCAALSEQRVCKNGVLTGSYRNASCTVEGAKAPSTQPAMSWWRKSSWR